MTGNATAPRNMIFNADCIDVMQAFDTGTVDFILTDPPYVTRFRDRQGRTVANDDNGRWLRPAFRQMHRVLKDGGFCVSFYGWNRVDLFVERPRRLADRGRTRHGRRAGPHTAPAVPHARHRLPAGQRADVQQRQQLTGRLAMDGKMLARLIATDRGFAKARRTAS